MLIKYLNFELFCLQKYLYFKMSNPAVENAAPADEDDNDKGKFHLYNLNNLNGENFYLYLLKT